MTDMQVGMPRHAIAIARVSKSKQRPEDQTPGLTAYAGRKGYVLDAVVPIHGKSAFHGKQVKHVLAAVEAYVTRGTATVVIFRHVDRTSREGAFEGYDLIRRIMLAGARVEFSEQEYLNDQPGMLGLFFQMGFEESKVKSDRRLQGIQVRKAAGKLNGRVPWGYDSADGVLVPNTLGRQWIPRIYSALAAGDSLRSVARDLRTSGVKSPQSNDLWDYSSVRRVVANPTYKGDRAGKGEMEYEALVSADLWSQANLAVSTSATVRRSATTRPAALVIPVCGECYGVKRDGCLDGISPMYRMTKAPRRDGTKYDYYGCRGLGTQRKGCGATVIPCAELDSLITGFIALDVTPHTTTVYHPAVDNTEAIKEISKRISRADSEGDDDLMEKLVSERKGLRLLPMIPAWKEEKPSGMTRAEHFATLDLDGRREMLTKVTWLARKRSGVTEFGIETEPGTVNWIKRKP